MSYYEKILCFTNICVFVNKPENLDDEENVNKIITQYAFNKRLLHPKISSQFNESCLYIINQIDTLDKDTPEEKLIEQFKKIIKEVDPSINDLKISCFSASYYLKYLSFEKLFKEQKTEKIEKIWEYFYEKYQNLFFKIFRSFGSTVMKSIEKNESYFKIKFDDNLLGIKCEYKDKVIKEYSKMEKLPKLDEVELNEISSHLYNFYLKLNDNNYKFFNVRKELITDIENKINKANELISRNYIFSLQNFFEGLDPLFEDENEELKKEDEKSIEKYIIKVQKESIPKVKNKLEKKKNSIIKVFEIVEKEIKNTIKEEKEKVNEMVKKNNDEIKAAFMNFQQKVEFKIKEMENEVNKEFDNLGVEIKEYYDQSLKLLNTGLFKYEDSLKLINKNINRTLFAAYTLTGLKFISGANIPLGVGASIALMITGGPIGIVFGIAYIAIFIGGGLLQYKLFSKEAKEYYDYYNNYKQNIETNILYSKEKIVKDFDDRAEIILKQLNMSLQTIKLRLHSKNDENYKKKCQEFKRIKKELYEKLPKN